MTTLTLEEAAWNLLDAMRQAEFAKGMEEQQHSRWEVTAAADALRKVLTALEEAKP
jgi:hypothetical protein